MIICATKGAMLSVRKSDIPAAALARVYLGQPKTRVDGYRSLVSRESTLETCVKAFYQGWLFRIERSMINFVTGHRSSDAQLEALLAGTNTKFSAWTQIARSETQLIMCDYQDRTCSWFMIETEGLDTYFYFGTILKPTTYFKRLEWLSKPIFMAALPLHGLYSRLLLGQASKTIRKDAG